VAERFKAVVLKTTVRKYRGFESRPLLSMSFLPSTAALCGLIAMGGMVAHGETATDSRGPAYIGEARPALELETLEGELITTARVGGRPLVVDFFATWCGPCHSALADLQAVRETAGRDSVFVLVSLGEPAETVRRWRTTANLPDGWIVALDPRGVAARRWGAAKLPTTFIVDAAGIVRHINRGWGSGYKERLARWLSAVGAARPPTKSTP
jgi:thiol-disulfide isomerase/thioredoxin